MKGKRLIHGDARRRRGVWVAIVLILALYLLGTLGIYGALMSRRTAAVWDFYQLWYGARVLFQQHRDPYDAEVALEMQQALYGRGAMESEGQPAFYYPLPILLLVAPFSLLPYSWAASAWLCLLPIAVVGAAGAVLWGLRWHVSPVAGAALGLWALALFPVTWSVLLGQVSVLLVLLLNTGLAALARGRDRMAGVCLVLCCLKPQMVLVLLPFVGMWVVMRRRWSVVAAGAVTALALAATSFLLLPSWPARLWTSVTVYASLSPFASPLRVLFENWLGCSADWPPILTGGLLVACCMVLWLRVGDEAHPLGRAFSVTLVVSAFLIPRVSTIGQVILVWPAVMAVTQWWRQSGGMRVAAVVLAAVTLFVPWLLAAAVPVPAGVNRYEVEHCVLAPFLPLVLGTVFGARMALGAGAGGVP